MEELYKQIKELEKNSKEAEYWKNRYLDLRDEVNNIIKRLGGLLTIKITGTTRNTKTTPKVKKIIDELYLAMQTKEEEIDVDRIKKA